MKNIAGKTRKKEQPYAWWVSPSTGWKYVLLKSHQADNSKEYARWFMWVEGIYSEYGDEYCTNVRGAHLRDALSIAPFGVDDNTNGWVWFDTTVWSTVGEFAAWAWGER